MPPEPILTPEPVLVDIIQRLARLETKLDTHAEASASAWGRYDVQPDKDTADHKDHGVRIANLESWRNRMAVAVVAMGAIVATTMHSSVAGVIGALVGVIH